MKRIAMAAACLAFLGAATDTLSQADRSAAFTAAGFKRTGQQWRACDDSSPSATPGTVDQVADLNGDGRPEALLSETSTNCYGSTESGYFLVSRQADGRWNLVTSGPGVLTVLAVKGAGGWPDLEIGGQGFCFPVQRWSGTAYKVVRYQYEGKPCVPRR